MHLPRNTMNITNVNILWRTQRRLKFEFGSERVKENKNKSKFLSQDRNQRVK
jgi:hypothetical protein